MAEIILHHYENSPFGQAITARAGLEGHRLEVCPATGHLP